MFVRARLNCAYMAIHETKKQTDIERRLRLLRAQVYGKTSQTQVAYSHASTIEHKSDISFLYKDLLRIGLFASVAIGAQVVIFFSFFERG